jgi:rfaE bifunctional protein kinase chain/domain
VRTKIMVVGDSMLDRYWFGDVDRISPEAPVPVVKMSREEQRPGAAANVARNVEAMGGECVTIFGVGRPIEKLRIIARNQQVTRVDFDHPQEPIEFLPGVDECGVVVFSDYGKGSLLGVKNLIRIAKDAKATVLVDPKGHEYERYRGADVIKPNLHEMKELVGGWSTEEQLWDKAEKLRREAGIGAILLTRADKGMSLFTEEQILNIPAVAHEVYDVSGAGDTAIAALAVALSRGHSLLAAAQFANRASGIVVGRFGTAVATEDEVFGA